MEDLLTGFKLGIIALLILPGFIFIQVVERHLLREKKPQFEKTLEIIFLSALIWIALGVIPICLPFDSEKGRIYNRIILALKENDSKVLFAKGDFVLDFSKYFFLVFGTAFIAGNVWGLVRKNYRVDAFMVWITGRNWYPSVSFQFYKSSLDKMLQLDLANRRYVGILFQAPDTLDDNYIIIKDVHEVVFNQLTNTWEMNRLELVQQMMVKITDIVEIKNFDSAILEKNA